VWSPPTGPQIEKSLQVAIEDARKAKATVLVIVGYNFTGLNLRSEWQQQSASEFARILLHVLLQDMNQHDGSSFELIGIVVDDQKEHDLYTTVFREWMERNIQDNSKDVSEEHDDQDVGASHVRSATDSSMASAGIDVMSISSVQEAVVSDSQSQRYNGLEGTITALRAERVEVQLDSGKWLEVPRGNVWLLSHPESEPRFTDTVLVVRPSSRSHSRSSLG
jgi:hypothetical protein